MHTIENQTLALAGLIQACFLVDQIARKGRGDEVEMQTAIDSLFVTNPGSTEEVFGSRDKLKTGLNLLVALLSKDSPQKQEPWVRYVLAVMHIETKVRKNQDMLAEIAKGLEQAKSTHQYFGPLHENTFANLAGTYQRSVSTLNTRIQVKGEPMILKSQHNADKIRTLLLAAVRAAMLWRQVGGHRWHLLFKRKALVDSANQLAVTLN